MPFVIIAKLALEAGGEQIQTTELAGSTLRIGRGTGNDLHLEDHSVQLNHAVIQEAGGTYILRDLGALSLTTVNGKPVREAVLTGEGTIRIGPYQFGFARPGPESPLTLEYALTAGAPGEPPAELPGSPAEGSKARRPETVAQTPVGGTPPAVPGPSPSRPARRLPEEKINLLSAFQLRTRYLSKTTITIAAVVLVLGGAVLAYALGKHRVFMPGPISMKHQLFADECVRCHTPWKPIMTVVADKTCLTCHSGPPHFKNQTLGLTPQCAGCHVEHKGRAALAAVYDTACVQCHADLKVKEGATAFAAKVHSFTADHPEFAVSVSQAGQKTPTRVRLDDKDRLVDTAAMKLNHKVHLGPDLMGPEGAEQLTCASCHKPDAQGAYMGPVSYEKDCMRCHLLDFDDRFPGKTAPHGKQMEEVARFLRATYAEFYLLEHQAELRRRGPAKRLPGAPKSQEEIWVEGMVEKAERFLLGKPDPKTKKGKCVLCHFLEPTKESSGADLKAVETGSRAFRSKNPTVVKTAMPSRWLPNSVFNHTAHNTLKCQACHEAAPQSQKTTDVLLPKAASCRTCHFEPGGARAQCTECHVFHDKTQTRHPAGQPGTIEQFRKGQALPISIAPAPP